MRLTDQLHTPAASSLGKQLPYPTKYEDVYAPEPACTFFFARNQTTMPPPPGSFRPSRYHVTQRRARGMKAKMSNRVFTPDTKPLQVFINNWILFKLAEFCGTYIHLHSYSTLQLDRGAYVNTNDTNTWHVLLHQHACIAPFVQGTEVVTCLVQVSHDKIIHTRLNFSFPLRYFLRTSYVHSG